MRILCAACCGVRESRLIIRGRRRLWCDECTAAAEEVIKRRRAAFAFRIMTSYGMVGGDVSLDLPSHQIEPVLSADIAGVPGFLKTSQEELRAVGGQILKRLNFRVVQPRLPVSVLKQMRTGIKRPIPKG
jgi:hypothetical protein